ncbi:hypothetical protein ABTY61_22855 [Kitasatospora sp. NPDC096128]|uniref:hypothetical protein n=1 Tax=Kitasatospora sp. NPDC096128 TaxID=3155547 RepID=UPI00331D47C5
MTGMPMPIPGTTHINNTPASCEPTADNQTTPQLPADTSDDLGRWTVHEGSYGATDDPPAPGTTPLIVADWDHDEVKDPRYGDLRLMCFTTDGQPAVVRLSPDGALQLRDRLDRILS